MTELASKLGDTAVWSVIGAVVLGLLLKGIQTFLLPHHRQDDKGITAKAGRD